MPQSQSQPPTDAPPVMEFGPTAEGFRARCRKRWLSFVAVWAGIAAIVVGAGAGSAAICGTAA